MSGAAYTAEELRKFDALTEGTSSQNGLTRIQSRLKLDVFIKEHGREKCDAMFEVLKKRDEAKAQRKRRGKS